MLLMDRDVYLSGRIFHCLNIYIPFLHSCILHPHISLRVLLLLHSIRACVPGSPTQDTLVERRKLAKLHCRIQNILVADQRGVRDAPRPGFLSFKVINLPWRTAHHYLNLRKPGSVIGVFPNWSRTFIEFGGISEFSESHKSLKHELGSI